MSSPCDVVLWGKTDSGKPARMGSRTAAHVDYTIARLAKEHPGAKLVVIQSSYNTGVKKSAGTHDKDLALDVYIEGLDWRSSESFLRRCGWAAWYRYPPTFGRHIHMVSLGSPGCPVGRFIPGQISDYMNGKDGLAGHRRDTGPRVPSIQSTIFDYEEWIKDMTPDQIASAPIEMLVGNDNKPRKVTLQAVLRDLEGTQDRHGSMLNDIDVQLADLDKKLDKVLGLLEAGAAPKAATQ